MATGVIVRRAERPDEPSSSGGEGDQARPVDPARQPARARPDREPPRILAAPLVATRELASASAALTEAEFAETASQRFLSAHLAALRVAAVVLACRATGRVGAAGPRDVWQVLAEAAPEYAEWAGFFASSSAKREAVRAGAVAMVSAREADDLVRDVGIFRDLVARRLSGATARSEVS